MNPRPTNDPPAADQRSLLDAWLPDAAVGIGHRRAAAIAPDVLWRASQAVTLAETGPLGRLVRWRIPGTPAETSFGELFRRYPFAVLDEGERHLVAGLAGRIWTLGRDYPRLSGPEDFLAWDERGTVRVAFAHRVEADDERAILSTEARIAPTDRLGAVRLRALWALIGRFEGLVASHGLRAAERRAAT